MGCNGADRASLGLSAAERCGSSADGCDNPAVPLLPLPAQCIWCRADMNSVPTNISQVLPECLGNAEQQILRAGIVCAPCNSDLGKKVEAAFLRDPRIQVIASFLQVVDPGDQHIFREKVFDAEHKPISGIHKNLSLDLKLRGSRVELGVTTALSGTLVHEYTHRDLRLLSRAIHKIAFESLAWQIYVADSKVPEDRPILNPLCGVFDPVRKWGREGQPMDRVRPVFRKPATTITRNWDVRLWSFPEGFGCELNLFADWYAVSLTSPPELTEGHLRQWTAGMPGKKWMIADSLIAVYVPPKEEVPK